MPKAAPTAADSAHCDGAKTEKTTARVNHLAVAAHARRSGILAPFGSLRIVRQRPQRHHALLIRVWRPLPALLRARACALRLAALRRCPALLPLRSCLPRAPYCAGAPLALRQSRRAVAQSA